MTISEINTSNLCRKCNSEIESISHVTGKCPSKNHLITCRHHNAKHQLTKLLQEKKLHCFEEVYAIDTDGRSRFSDIIAINPESKEAFIVDPTIRYETSDPEQDEKIRAEKEEIYSKCIPFYDEKYSATFGKCKWKVRGLWFGSRVHVEPVWNLERRESSGHLFWSRQSSRVNFRCEVEVLEYVKHPDEHNPNFQTEDKMHPNDRLGNIIQVCATCIAAIAVTTFLPWLLFGGS